LIFTGYKKMDALTLPWPNRTLHPNARVHWAALAKARKVARQDAHALALAAGWRSGVVPSDGRLHLWIDFYPPDRRRRDDDDCWRASRPRATGLPMRWGLTTGGLSATLLCAIRCAPAGR
jgi:hypothetical protein